MYTVITKEDFKKYKHVAGIYMFRNKINDKKYIGQSINLYNRLTEHLYRISTKDVHTHVLYKAVQKYGIDNFEICVLTTFPPHDQLRKNLNLSEMIYIQFFDTYKNGYNSTLGGDGVLSYKWSEESKKKLSCSLKKKHFSRKGENNGMSKHVYLYNFEKDVYSDYCSTTEASIKIGLNKNAVGECARGRNKRAGSYICAYSKEELEIKIVEFKDWISKNKYRTISPNYKEYFEWLVEHADKDGIIPISKEIAKHFNIKTSSVADWNSHIRDKIEHVRIGNRDKLKIKNYDHIKDKKIE